MAISAIVVLKNEEFGVYKGATRYLCDDPQEIKTGQEISAVDTQDWFPYGIVAPWAYAYNVTSEAQAKWSAEIIVQGSPDNSNWTDLDLIKIGTDPDLFPSIRDNGRGNISTAFRYYRLYVDESKQWADDGTVTAGGTVAYIRAGIQAPA